MGTNPETIQEEAPQEEAPQVITGTGTFRISSPFTKKG